MKRDVGGHATGIIESDLDACACNARVEGSWFIGGSESLSSVAGRYGIPARFFCAFASAIPTRPCLHALVGGTLRSPCGRQRLPVVLYSALGQRLSRAAWYMYAICPPQG